MVSVGATSMSRCIDDMNQGSVSRQGQTVGRVDGNAMLN